LAYWMTPPCGKLGEKRTSWMAMGAAATSSSACCSEPGPLTWVLSTRNTAARLGSAWNASSVQAISRQCREDWRMGALVGFREQPGSGIQTAINDEGGHGHPHAACNPAFAGCPRIRGAGILCAPRACGGSG